MSRHHPFTPEQLNGVEKADELYPKIYNGSKVMEMEDMKAATPRAFEVDTQFHSTATEKYFADSAAAEERRRARRKTPEQIQALQEAFDEDMYPCTGRQIIISHQTGLEPKKVRNWFENQRARLPKTNKRDSNKIMDQEKAKYAQKMWRDYKENPEEMVEGLLAGTINGATGERQVDDVRGYHGNSAPAVASPSHDKCSQEKQDEMDHDEAMEYALQSQVKTYLT